MHMVWMKYTCGRIKSDFRYSNTVVYNNFPWPDKPSKAKVNEVTEAVKSLLKIRGKLEKESSPTDIYKSNSMPKSLLDAHKKISKAVDKCYTNKDFKNDVERVEFLFDKYSELVKKEEKE